MKKTLKNQKGFAVVESLLILLILVVGAGVGYVVYKNNHKTNTASVSYAGWRTYCDSQAKLCFKYPPDWQAQDQSTGDFISEEIWSPHNDMNAAYLDQPSTPTSYPYFSFYTYSIGNMSSSNSPYKVIEGNTDISNVYSPSIFLADNSAVTKYKLQEGKSSKAQTFTITDNSSSGNQISFSAGPASNRSFTATTANQWYSSTNAKTLEKILESIYLE